MQLELLDRVPLRVAVEAGEQAADACLAKAEREGFDAEGAGKFIVGWLRRYGPTTNESLVTAAEEHGYRGHTGKCFGPVFKRLRKHNEIKALQTGLPRIKGHGTPGATLYGVVR